MLTTVSEVRVREGSEATWDDVMRHRLDAVRGRQGWISCQVLKPEDGSSKRIVIGTWESRDDWAAWHKTAAFQETRRRLDELEDGRHQQWWHELTVAATTGASAAAG
jgi:heme-degrading monooxygenase HmoA